MKVFISALLIGLTFIISPAGSMAADPQVILTHKVTGSVKGPNTIDITISVQVANPGVAPISNVTLSFVPLPPFISGGATLNIGNLGPHQSVNVPLQVSAPAFVTVDQVSRRPLFWSGACFNAQGVRLEFPVTSNPGGVL